MLELPSLRVHKQQRNFTFSPKITSKLVFHSCFADFSGISFFSCCHDCDVCPWNLREYCGTDCCMHCHCNHGSHPYDCLLLAEASEKEWINNQTRWVWRYAYGVSLEAIEKVVQLRLVSRHGWVKRRLVRNTWLTHGQSPWIILAL